MIPCSFYPIGIILAVFAEMYLDKKIVKVVDLDNIRTIAENNLLHKDQLPMRGLLIVFWSMNFGEHIHNKVMWVIAGVFMFWWLFDMAVAVFWLHKGPFYLGSTSDTDKKFKPWINWTLKIVGTALFTTLAVTL